MIGMAKWQCKRVHTEAGTPVPDIAKDAVRPEDKEEPAPATKTKKSEQVQPHGALKEYESRDDKLKKLHAVIEQRGGRRVTKHNREVMQSMAGHAVAEKELVTKDLLAKGKLALEADKAIAHRAAELTTDTKLEEKKNGLKEGEALPYEGDRIARFAEVELKDLMAAGTRESYKEPLAVVLAGVQKEGWGDEGQGVALWNAFGTPERHVHMTKFICKFVEDSGAHAALMISPREKVTYPNLFEKNKALASCPKGQGYLVQLQAKEKADCAAWFVEVAKEGGVGVVTKLSDVEEWKLMPNIFDPAQMLQDAANLTKKQMKAKGKKNAAKAARQAMSAVN